MGRLSLESAMGTTLVNTTTHLRDSSHLRVPRGNTNTAIHHGCLQCWLLTRGKTKRRTGTLHHPKEKWEYALTHDIWIMHWRDPTIRWSQWRKLRTAWRMPRCSHRLMHAVDTGSSLWMKKAPSSSHSTPHGGVTLLQGFLLVLHQPQRSTKGRWTDCFAGIPVEIIVDDFLIHGDDQRDIDQKLKQVLDRSREVGLKFNPKKLKLRVPEVSYVGHLFSADGLKPDPEKIRAIKEMSPPTDKEGVLQFLGTLNYLDKFIEHKAELQRPLGVVDNFN